jgi:hypothetical protein
MVDGMSTCATVSSVNIIATAARSKGTASA